MVIKSPWICAIKIVRLVGASTDTLSPYGEEYLISIGGIEHDKSSHTARTTILAFHAIMVVGSIIINIVETIGDIYISSSLGSAVGIQHTDTILCAIHQSLEVLKRRNTVMAGLTVYLSLETPPLESFIFISTYLRPRGKISIHELELSITGTLQWAKIS